MAKTAWRVILFAGIAVLGFAAGIRYVQWRFPRSSAVQATPSGSQPVATPPAPGGYSLFLVALGDNGDAGKMIGCGDSLVRVGTPATNVTDALNALLAIRTPFYGQSGLDTALSQSTLAVIDASPARVDLTGQFMLGGECDNPRAEEQINATVHQFPGYEKTPVFVNGKALHDALSLK